MDTETKHILDRALMLPDREKAQLVDELLSNLDKPDDDIDRLWREEIKDRIKAYESGKIKSLSLKQVLSKYQK
ncbi:MAG: addiction module protein [Nitrospinota bacterium]